MCLTVVCVIVVVNVIIIILKFSYCQHMDTPCGAGAPLSPLSIYFLIFSPFYFSLSFIGFTYFLLLSIPPLSFRIVPFHFQAGGRRRRLNLGLVYFVCVICIPKFRCILVFCYISFSFVCSFSALTLLVGSFDL